MVLRTKTKGFMSVVRQFCVLMLTLIVMSVINIAHAKIIKWVDERGVTHYGDSLPTQYTGHSTTELSERATVIKQNKPISVIEERASSEKQEQDKKDKALLASYSSPQEIDEARDRNLQLYLATMQTLIQQKQVTEARGSAYLKTSDTLTKQKKSLPANLVSDLAIYKTGLAKIDSKITENKNRMEQTKQRYEAEKARYIILKSSEAGAILPNAPQPSPTNNLPANSKPINTQLAPNK